MNPADEYSLYPKDRARAFLEKKKAPAAVIPKAASATILKFSLDLWEPTEGAGIDVLLYPVEDADWIITNIVAWMPYEPHRWWLRHDAGDHWLGLRDLMMAANFDKQIRVFDTPFDWLMADKKGCVPLSEEALPDLLGMTVDCSDAMFARIKKAIELAYPMPKRAVRA